MNAAQLLPIALAALERLADRVEAFARGAGEGAPESLRDTLAEDLAGAMRSARVVMALGEQVVPGAKPPGPTSTGGPEHV